MSDRAATFERVLRLEPGRTALLVADGAATLWSEIQRATLDIVSRASGHVVQSKGVLSTISTW